MPVAVAGSLSSFRSRMGCYSAVSLQEALPHRERPAPHAQCRGPASQPWKRNSLCQSNSARFDQRCEALVCTSPGFGEAACLFESIDTLSTLNVLSSSSRWWFCQEHALSVQTCLSLRISFLYIPYLFMLKYILILVLNRVSEFKSIFHTVSVTQVK